MAKPTEKIYDEVRQALGFGEDEHHGWTIKVSDSHVEPLTVKGQQIITPYPDVLKNPNWKKYIAFHPLAENSRRKKSIIFERLQSFVSVRLRSVILTLLGKMSEIALHTELHDSLSVDQRAFLTIFEKANDKTLKKFSSLFKKMLEASPGENELISVFVRRSGTWKGEDYARLCTISFPVMQEEYVEGGKVYDVDLNKSNKTIFFEALRYLLPGIDNVEHYCYGSRSDVAPNFHSLMMAFNSVASDLNKVTKLLDSIETAWAGDESNEATSDIKESCYILTSWAAQMPYLHDHRDTIPVLDGNDGEVSQDDVDKEREAKARREERESRNDRRPVVRAEDRNPFTRSVPRDDDRNDRRDDRRRDSRRDERDYDRRRDRDYDRDDDRRRTRSRRSYRDDRDYDRRDDRDRDYDRRRDRDEDRGYHRDSNGTYRDENGVSILSDDRYSRRRYRR